MISKNFKFRACTPKCGVPARRRDSLISTLAVVGAGALFLLQFGSYSTCGMARASSAGLLRVPFEQGKRQAVKAPDFSLLNSQGKTVTLSSFKGKVVVINFWATWCGPCRAEIPDFLKVYNKYKSKGLEIIGISLDDDGWDVINAYVKKLNITYPVVLGSGEVVADYGGITAIPTTFVVDRNGNIVSGRVGLMTKSQLEEKLDGLL